MSKLSKAVQILIREKRASILIKHPPQRPSVVYKSLLDDASTKGVGRDAILTLATAATATKHDQDVLKILYDTFTDSLKEGSDKEVATAELMREVVLKCTGFYGIPRTINHLNALSEHFPSAVQEKLSKTPTREATPGNIEEIIARGTTLWNSVYGGKSSKLLHKLSNSHPDLPVHILHAEYGSLLSDPPSSHSKKGRVGRVLTSICAIGALRAQDGAEAQLLSHVYGLRNAVEDGSWKAEGEEVVQGTEWLVSDEGCLWLLETADRIWALQPVKRDVAML